MTEEQKETKAMTDASFLRHEGVLRKSGRYPWGSGANPEQRARSFKTHVAELQKQGMTPTEIANAFSGVDADGKEYKMTTTQLRALTSISNDAIKRAEIREVAKYAEKGMSNVAIGEKMGKNESSIRALRAAAEKDDKDAIQTTADIVRKQVDEKQFIDFGAGTANHLGVSNERLGTAIAVLKEEGYKVHYLKVEQMIPGQFTSFKVLTKGDVTYSDVLKNKDNIVPLLGKSEDGGRTFTNLGMLPPLNVNLKRVGVRYAEEGGADKDGVIEIRRGVKDLDMGNSRYAQVRIGVNGTHYLKGMAMYSDAIPDGVDMVFNTNKSDKGDKLAAMKPQKDEQNPFGSAVRQITKKNKDGSETVTSALNIVNEEGDWTAWSNKLSSQMLSKQSPVLAKAQLQKRYDQKQAEYDEIMALTNPVVKRKLLESFADGADSSAVHLKAAGLPRTANHVILPINSLKDNEVYAPKYKDGEKVVLIRHPHGGTFEIPELTVNNKNREANSVIKQARDAIGINARVAERLSGADFDGDTVLVIPNPAVGLKVKSSAPLEGLKNFNPQKLYKLPDDAPKMTPKAKGQQMGDVSNLITDMTIKDAPFSDIARAVRHSMVVIDAEKHHLDYKQSAKDNGIAELKKQYQGKSNAGASTIISRSKSEVRVNDRKLRSAKDGGPVDAKTGKKVYVETGETYRKWDKEKKEYVGDPIPKTVKVKKMDYVDDARKLVSDGGGTVMEHVYADHANKLKALANNSRKAVVATKPLPYSPSAKKAYAPEVKELNAALNEALKNKPLERKAQLIANQIVMAKRQAEPDMDAAQLKKAKALALEEGRARTGAEKQSIKLTPRQWEAIQAGAISTNMLEKILDNGDLNVIKELATPRERTVMTNSNITRAKAMMARGFTQADIAAALGVPTSTLDSALNPPTTD